MSTANEFKLKYIADYISRGDAPDYVDKSDIQVINQACVWPGGLDFSKIKYHNPDSLAHIKSWIHLNDILVNSTGTGTLGRTTIVDAEPAKPTFADGHVTVLRDSCQRFYPKFLFYTLSIQQKIITALCSEGATNQIELSRSRFGDFLVYLPSLSKQRAIADYLDYTITKIDSLIAAKQRLLDLMTEKRSALITYAITRGLDADAPMRNFGVEWLGKIPAHWNLEYARELFREIDERSITGEEELLTVSHLTGVTLRSEKDVNMFMAESNEGYKICQAGDLVINTLWAWMGAMGVAFQNGIVSPAYNVYRPLERYEPRYIDHLVRMRVFAQEVTRYSKGVWSSRLRLYPEEFFQVILPVPPLSEQREIADHIEREISKLDNLHIVTEKTIRLLQERRTALIAAAVTDELHIE
ncbi:MAG: restriction endonuclease subunit S [Caldilinea sp. CFX5]|nr:restriction endonuclease subunit S [Caldilinea sp. CFX5]